MPDNKISNKPRILLAPLDWGLGHTTRCVPIIEELLEQGCEVILAGNTDQEALLKAEFPSLDFLSLPGYNVRYANKGRNMPWKILQQFSRIKKSIRREHQWLKQKVEEMNIDAVISDNRFGLYHEKIPCAFITHQLTIKSPWKWTERIIQKKNYHYINRFAECWVPDHEGNDNLAGELSHPIYKPNCPIRYLGHLTRFKKKGITEIKNSLLIILSGPEPQRSIFENKIIDQVSKFPGTATIIRGLPASKSMIPSTNSIYFFNHMPAEQLNEEMEKAEFVIARSGFSTIMDAMSLHKKCIFIPTPGQTEQNYLAKYLSEKKFCFIADEKNFSLTDSLNKASGFDFQFPETGKNNNLKDVVRQFLTTLSA